jgi:hypothetical protein
MINTLAKLAQKPTDRNIRITRVVFALILITIIYFGWDVTVVNFGLPAELKYALYVFPIIGLIRGLLDPGIVRKWLWRWVITAIGIKMLVISLIFIDDMEPKNTTVAPVVTISGESGVSLADLTTGTEESSTFSLSTDNWFGFFGFVLLIIGFLLNGKNTTAKNERYGEVIKKIRV